MCKKFLDNSFNVFCSRSIKDLTSFKDSLSSDYDSNLLHPIEVDLTSLDDIDKLFNYIHSNFSSLSCLINNAAVIKVEEAENVSFDSLKNQVDVNIIGLYNCIQKAIPLMKDKGGNIVNVSSLSGIKGVEKFPGFSVYAMTKSAVVGLTEVLAVELKKYNINVMPQVL